MRGLTPFTRKVKGGYQSIVVDIDKANEEITGVWYDLETAEKMAVQSIIDIQISSVWNTKERIYPKACWDE